MKRRIRMIGFDLDGTLLTTDKRLTRYTREVLERAIRQGIIVLAVTGRPLRGVPPEICGFEGMRYLITSNGARILEEGETIRENLLPAEKARKILDIFEEYDTLRDVYYDGQGYMPRNFIEIIGNYVDSPEMVRYMVTTRIPIDDIRQKLAEENRGLDKIQALFRKKEDKLEAWKRVRDLEGVEVTGALSMNIEVNAGGVHKGAALLWLADRLGIAREEIMAFGDGSNDVKMIKEAGIGVAMANAVPEALAAADITARSNDEEGVAGVIEEYLDA